MTVLPEKLSHRQKVRGAIAAQFWEQPISSTRSIDGIGRTLPCEPPPLTQTAPSGLSRTQQLLAAQALRVPFLPVYDASEGGWVGDRVLAKVGGRSWWSAIAGRARLHSMFRQHREEGKSVADVVKDLNNYCLCSRTRIGIGRHGAFNSLVEVPNVAVARAAIQGDSASDQSSAAPARFRATLQHSLPGHDVVATAAVNQDYLDSAMAYCGVPLAISLDLSSKDRADGIQYRAGLHHASVEESEGAAGGLHAEGSAGSTLSGSNQQAGARRSSLHFQGAVAVEGEAVLWKPRSGDPWRVSSGLSEDKRRMDSLDDLELPDLDLAAAITPHGPDPVPASGSTTEEPASDTASPNVASEPMAPPGNNPATSTTSPYVAVNPRLRQDTGEPHSAPGPRGAQPVLGDLAVALPPRRVPPRGAATAAGPQQRPRLALRGLAIGPGGGASAPFGETESGHDDVQPATRGVTRPGAELLLSDIREQLDAVRAMLPPGPLLPPGISAKSIQDGLAAAQGLVNATREGVATVVREVSGGALQPRRPGGGTGRRHPPRTTPYSPWVSQPGVKVNAAVGCLARIPMPHRAFRPLKVKTRSGGGSGASLGDAGQSAAGVGEAGRDVGRSESRLSRFASELWTPYLRGTALRVFASGSISAQAGRFTRRFLDFTSLSMRFDCGLTSPHAEPPAEERLGRTLNDTWAVLPAGTAAPGLRHRAFALEGRGMWHAVSLSAAQQLFGPIRLRADARIAIENPVLITDGNPSNLVHSLVEAARSLRPSLLETVYGIDVVLPGSEGLARAAIWYSPSRREGMAEIRIF